MVEGKLDELSRDRDGSMDQLERAVAEARKAEMVATAVITQLTER